MQHDRSVRALAVVALALGGCTASGSIGSSPVPDSGFETDPPDAGEKDTGVAAVVTAIEVTPARLTLVVGETGNLTATVRDQFGQVMDGQTVNWTSSQTAFATVDAGVVSAVAEGMATITAAVGDVTGTAQIDVVVNAPDVATVEVSPASSNLTVGQTVTLTATPRDAQGNVIARPVSSWSSANTQVATVNDQGLVTAVSEGNTSITATVDNVTGTADIQVAPAPQAVIVVDPNQTFQTMIGLEATAQIGQLECLIRSRTAYNNYKNEVLDRAVDELGLDRIRLEYRTGFEKTRDGYDEVLNQGAPFSVYADNRYNATNDNNDPNTINPAGFRWSELDHAITEIVNPLRTRLSAQGRELYVNLCAVGLTTCSTAATPRSTPSSPSRRSSTFSLPMVGFPTDSKSCSSRIPARCPTVSTRPRCAPSFSA